MGAGGRGKHWIANTCCRAFWPLLVSLLCFVALPAALASQTAGTNARGNLTGHVTDSTGEPISDATVRLTGAAHSQWIVSTDPAGRFAFSNLPFGTYVVLVRRLGYRADYSTTAVTADTGVMVGVVLHKTPTRLNEVVIDAPIVLFSSGFEHRRKAGAGYYVTAEDIAKRRIFDFAGVLNLSPVLRVARERGGPVVTSTKPTAGGGYGCASVLIGRSALWSLFQSRWISPVWKRIDRMVAQQNLAAVAVLSCLCGRKSIADGNLNESRGIHKPAAPPRAP